MVSEIEEDRKKKNNNNWSEWKIIVPKSEQIFQKLHGWTKESNLVRVYSFVRLLACSLASSLALFSPSLIASIKESYYTVLFSSIRDYFSLFSLLTISLSPPSTFHSLGNLFNIRFITLKIAVSPNNLFSPFCAHFSIWIKLKRIPSRFYWNCCKFQGTF